MPVVIVSLLITMTLGNSTNQTMAPNKVATEVAFRLTFTGGTERYVSVLSSADSLKELLEESLKLSLVKGGIPEPSKVGTVRSFDRFH